MVPFRDESRQVRTMKALLETAKWYAGHIAQYAVRARVVLLTSDYQVHKAALEAKLSSVPLLDFLKQNDSNLLDYLGFASDTPSKTLSSPVFAEHMDREVLLAGIKQGLYLEGKFMDAKSYFKVGSEMFSCGVDNNRAMYGDVVAILLYPPTKWRRNLFVLQDEEQPAADQPLVAVEHENRDLLQTLRSTDRVPSGLVVGIVRRQPRTCCGSLTAEVVEKLEGGEEIREFVPVDPRLPSMFVKTFNVRAVQSRPKNCWASGSSSPSTTGPALRRSLWGTSSGSSATSET